MRETTKCECKMHKNIYTFFDNEKNESIYLENSTKKYGKNWQFAHKIKHI